MSILKFNNYLKKVNSEFKNCELTYDEGKEELIHIRQFEGKPVKGEFSLELASITQEDILLHIDGYLFSKFPSLVRLIIKTELFEQFQPYLGRGN